MVKFPTKLIHSLTSNVWAIKKSAVAYGISTVHIQRYEHTFTIRTGNLFHLARLGVLGVRTIFILAGAAI